MDEKHERIWRRKAIRLTLRGLRPKDIRKHIPRSRRWLCKWQARYQMLGWRGLHSESRRPHRCAHRYSYTTCRRIVCIRRRLEHAKLGWIGAKAIQRTWERRYPRQPCPSKSSIYTILHRTGVLRPPSKRVAYCPRPTTTPQFVLHAMD